MNDTVLVTGGAGYIGSHVVDRLVARGDTVIVVDDLSTGLRSRLTTEIIELDVTSDGAVYRLRKILAEHRVSAVIHFAALKRADESVKQPVRYWRANMVGLLNILSAIQGSGVGRFVFSSSAAVYGKASIAHVSEDTPTNPINPYGSTKLAGEQVVREFHEATNTQCVSLRYFNVAGAARDELADQFSDNLFGATFKKLATHETPVIYGNQHETPDGTCVRDFIHVSDLAAAHVAALDKMLTNELAPAYNIGTGRGYSVAEAMRAIDEATGIHLNPVIAPPRLGDPGSVVADPSAANRDLDWHAHLGLRDMVESAWSGWGF